MAFDVKYHDGYPDQLPELSAEPLEGDIGDEEITQLLNGLKTLGEENLGMAMTFTLVSHLRERLSDFVRSRAERKRHEEAEKERLLLEAEEAKTRGTAITRESFIVWKSTFDKEIAVKKAKELEDKLKGLTPKEREEFKRLRSRLSGRQLFERNKDWGMESDDSLLEEEGTSVDISQYERTRIEEEHGEDEDHVQFSDSD